MAQMIEVKQMVRTLFNVSNDSTGISSSSEVDYELMQYFNRGFVLHSVHSLGDFKNGSELLPRVLYVLVKYADEPVEVVQTATRGRPKSTE